MNQYNGMIAIDIHVKNLQIETEVFFLDPVNYLVLFKG